MGLLQGNRLTLLPPEVSEGGGRGCHLGVVGVIRVSSSEYIFWCHTSSTREYTLVSFPGHTQFSRHTRVSGDQHAADE